MIKNLASNKLLATRVRRANSFGKRLRGLMFTKSFPADFEVLLFSPCNSVHTMFMRYAIDVVFLDQNFKIVHLCHQLMPGKVSPLVKGSHFVLELEAGKARNWGIEVGDQLGLNEKEGWCSDVDSRHDVCLCCSLPDHRPRGEKNL